MTLRFKFLNIYLDIHRKAYIVFKKGLYILCDGEEHASLRIELAIFPHAQPSNRPGEDIF